MSKYGDPFGNWPYDKFLTGANDKQGNWTQFAPKLKSDGGAWDPDEWAQMFADAGAKYAGPVAEHHDGFSMWDSKVNEWNAVATGPKLNLAKLHVEAIRKKGLKIIMSEHTAYNFTGYYQYAPAASTDTLKKLYGQLPNADEQTLWLNKHKEIIDEFLPDILWQDFNLNQLSDANLTAFLAYYYNAALDANKEVVATAKDGILSPHTGQVRDYERGGPADITTPYWLTDDAVSSSSWGYTQGMQYYSTTALIHAFVDRVSKGGNLLLNLSPMADGTFPQQQKDIMTAFGKFLKQMGTAIYSTRAWAVYGEGPTKLGGGGMASPTAMTSSDVRYTKSKDGDAVYALLMGWPGNGKQVTLASVTTSRFDLGSGKVFLFGPSGNGGDEIALQATQDGAGLHVTLPSTQPYTATAYAIKISKSGNAPGPTPWGTADPVPTEACPRLVEAVVRQTLLRQTPAAAQAVAALVELVARVAAREGAVVRPTAEGRAATAERAAANRDRASVVEDLLATPALARPRRIQAVHQPQAVTPRVGSQQAQAGWAAAALARAGRAAAVPPRAERQGIRPGLAASHPAARVRRTGADQAVPAGPSCCSDSLWPH